MKKQYVKTPLNEEVFESGGAVVTFVNKQTLPLDGAIDEALLGNYVLGQKTLIYQTFLGLMRSICDGIQRDGKARQIGDFITLYPVVKGPIDLERGFDPEVNRVIIRCHLLNEMVFDIDTCKWTFEDVTPGKRAFTLESVSTGEADGEYVIGEAGHINGRNLPSTGAGDDLRIEWAVAGTDRHGEIATSKRTSDVSRIDIAEDALDGLKDAGYDGKEIVFTVRGNFSKASVKATLRFAAPGHEITKIVGGPAGTPDDVVKSACWIDIYGRGLEVAADGDVTADTTYRGESVHYAWNLSKVRMNGDGHVQLDYVSIDGGTTSFIADDNTEVVFTVNGASHTAVYNPS